MEVDFVLYYILTNYITFLPTTLHSYQLHYILTNYITFLPTTLHSYQLHYILTNYITFLPTTLHSYQLHYFGIGGFSQRNPIVPNKILFKWADERFPLHFDKHGRCRSLAWFVDVSSSDCQGCLLPATCRDSCWLWQVLSQLAFLGIWLPAVLDTTLCSQGSFINDVS